MQQIITMQAVMHTRITRGLWKQGKRVTLEPRTWQGRFSPRPHLCRKSLGHGWNASLCLDQVSQAARSNSVSLTVPPSLEHAARRILMALGNDTLAKLREI